MEARANMEAMTNIIQGWVELHLLQSSVTDASESWIRYLDHIDDKVQDGLFQLLLRALHFLSENTHPQHLRQVGEEAERLRAGLDRFSHLWQSDRQAVMQEFLTYSRQLGPEELEAEETPPTLKDFQREIDLLHRLGQEVTHLDEVTVLHGWLQVDLQPFRNSLLSLICTWKNMYTDYLLASVCDSLQQVTRCGDEDSSCSSSFPLTETIILLEAAGVELPEHLSAQLQC
ncbi:hypothetical protein INR49_006325 [Caranx melampygus]|nr:hypothetical protein INR49_006325 [Caranx melampygus]